METTCSRVRPGGRHEFGDAGQPAGPRPVLYRLTRRVAAEFRRAKAFVAGILIGLSAWTPVFVVTAEETDWQHYGLQGGLALFAAGVWLCKGTLERRRREAQPRDPAGPLRRSMDRLPA